MFFNVAGAAGDTFEVVINGSGTVHGIGGLGFESKTPTSPVIHFLGNDQSTGANWRSSSVAKESAVDPDGDNVFATDGYYAINSGGSGAPVVSALPAYISAVANHGGTFNSTGYPVFDNPIAVIGPTVTDARAGIFFAGVGGPIAIVDFELAEAAEFVLSIPLGGNNSSHRPTSLSLSRIVGGAFTTTAVMPPSLSGDAVNYVFFDVKASAGDKFEVVINGASSIHGIAGLGFEAHTPTPRPIRYLGADEATGANWRSSSVPKLAAIDPNGDNAYASNGYYAIAGGSGVGVPVVSSFPSFIAAVTDHGNTFNSTGYPNFDNPTLAIAPAVADADSGLFFAATAGTFAIMDFELAKSQEFVLTIPLTGNQFQHRPSTLSVTRIVGGAFTVAAALPVPVNGDAVNYLFFVIDGAAGDKFEVAINGAATIHGIGGLGFETFRLPTVLRIR